MGQEHLEKIPARVEDFVVRREDGRYVAKVKSQVLRTLQGNVITSRSGKIFDRIMADFRPEGDLTVEEGIIVAPRVHSAYLLVSTQIDLVEKGDHHLKDVAPCLEGDPIFNVSAGPELFMYQLLAWTHAVDYLRRLNIPFKRWTGYTAGERSQLVDAFSKAVSGFGAPQLSVLVTLSALHHNHFVYPVLFLLGACTPREYARAVYAGSSHATSLISYTPEAGELFAGEGTQRGADTQASAIVSGYRDDCTICAQYLEAMKE